MSRERVENLVAWSLAMVVPGGLVLMALWLSVRAAKRRALLAKTQPTHAIAAEVPAACSPVAQPVQLAPAANHSEPPTSQAA